MSQCPLINEFDMQRTLLIETLNILENSLGALRMGAINYEIIDNHCRAINAIRQHTYGEITRDPTQGSCANIQPETLFEVFEASTTRAIQQVENSIEQSAIHFSALMRRTRISDQVLKNGRYIHQSKTIQVWVWPWRWAASLKCIERRIQKAICDRNFAKAQRLDIEKRALILVKDEHENGY